MCKESSHIPLGLFLLHLTRWMKFGPVRETFHPHFFHTLVPRWSQWPTHEKVADDSGLTSVGLSIDGVRQKDLVVLIAWYSFFISSMKTELPFFCFQWINSFHSKLLFSFALHLMNSSVFSFTFSTIVVCSRLYFFSPSQEIGIICFQEYACGKLVVNVKYIHMFLWRDLPPACSGKEPEIWQEKL